MKSSWVAKVVEEVYYSGRIKNTARRLTYKDFQLLVSIAKASLLADLYRTEKQLGQFTSLNNFLSTYDVTIKTDKYNRRYFSLPVEVVSLPDNAGVYSFIPLIDGSLQFCEAFIRTEAGSEWMICGDDSGIGYFIPMKDKVLLYGGSDCLAQGQVTLIPATDDANIPDDIAFTIAKSIWQQVMGTRAFPVDKTADDNPNVDEILKTKLSSPQIS